MEHKVLDKELDELYKKTKKGEKKGLVRVFVAYLLKGISVVGGFIIAAGFLTEYDQIIGTAITLAVITDSITSNHIRMMAERKAAHAYRAVSFMVRTQFNRDIDSVNDKASQGDEEAIKKLEQMKRKAHRDLTNKIREIDEMLAEIDIKSLSKLATDDKKS